MDTNTISFLVAGTLFVVATVAAFLAGWQNTAGQLWQKFLGALASALAAAIVVFVVFGIFWATWSLISSTIIAPPKAEAPKVTVNVPQQQPPVVNIVVPTQVPPTATPIPTTVAPKPTAAPIATDRIKRLVALDKIYRNQGLEPWLHAAGFTWDGAIQQARQVEEETVIVDDLPKIVASGVQLKATKFHAAFPSCFTTDRPFVLDTNGRSFKPDANNPSVLVTNGVVSDTLTAYVNCSNWSQLNTKQP